MIGAGGAAEPAGGVGDASATAGASMRRGPLNRRSTWRPPLPPEANSALTSKANPPWPSIGLNRQVRRAWMTDSAQGDSPLFIRASATCPSGSSVTSAVTVAVSGPAPAGNAGTTPWRSSGMPSSRDISGRRILNSMGTVRITLTGLPSTFVISYSHSRAAVSAASSKGGTLRVTRADTTLPSGPTTSSRITMPRMPRAWASGG